MKKIISIIVCVCLLVSSSTTVWAADGGGLEPQYVVGIPSISSIATASGELIKGEPETVRVGISFTPGVGISDVSCVIKVFEKTGSSSSLIGTKTVVVSGNTSVDVPVEFSIDGSCQIYAELYRAGTKIDTSNTRAVLVKMRWRIEVVLPVDRFQEGTLTLYDGNGNVLMQVRCLGRSADNTPMNITCGNTPTGEYTGYLYGPADDTDAHGPHKVVAMQGVSGVVVDSGRSGIWIHGGRNSSPTATDYTLSPTYGCVRVTNGHQKQIQDLITDLINAGYHTETGNISIMQA